MPNVSAEVKANTPEQDGYLQIFHRLSLCFRFQHRYPRHIGGTSLEQVEYGTESLESEPGLLMELRSIADLAKVGSDGR